MQFITSTASRLTNVLLLASTLLSTCNAVNPRHHHLDYAQRNLNTIKAIYNLTLWPNNAAIVQAGAAAVPSGLFNANATGRVAPVGNFSGFTDSIEYFFALAPVPNNQSGNVAFYEADIVDFTSGCPEVASSLVYLRSASVNPLTGKKVSGGVPTSTLAQVAFWRFDSTGAVKDYQAWIPNLQRWTATGLGLDVSIPVVQTAEKTQLCPSIQQLCTGANQQYSSVASCETFLNSIPFGNFDEAWGNNVACRTIHTVLTKVRPEVHCPHVGPNGGSPPNNYKCVDVDYTLDYFDDALLYGQPEGTVFKCPS